MRANTSVRRACNSGRLSTSLKAGMRMVTSRVAPASSASRDAPVSAVIALLSPAAEACGVARARRAAGQLAGHQLAVVLHHARPLLVVRMPVEILRDHRHRL